MALKAIKWSDIIVINLYLAILMYCYVLENLMAVSFSQFHTLLSHFLPFFLRYDEANKDYDAILQEDPTNTVRPGI